MFLLQQVIKKFIIFELITKTTPKPKRKQSQCFEGNGKRKKKRISTPKRKSQSLTPGKSIIPLTLKVHLTVEKAPLVCRVSYPFPILSSQETRGNSFGT